MKQQQSELNERVDIPVRQPYTRPEIRRVDLAIEETLTAGCKLAGTECTDPFPGISVVGS